MRIRIDIEKLERCNVNFAINQGAFRTTASSLLSYSSDILLNIKRVGSSDQFYLTLQFFHGEVMHYSVKLGKHSPFVKMSSIRSIDPGLYVGPMSDRSSTVLFWNRYWTVGNNAGEFSAEKNLMELWRQLEANKDLLSWKAFCCQKMIVRQPTSTVMQPDSDSFDQMSDLEILQRLNARNKQLLLERKQPIQPEDEIPTRDSVGKAA